LGWNVSFENESKTAEIEISAEATWEALFYQISLSFAASSIVARIGVSGVEGEEEIATDIPYGCQSGRFEIESRILSLHFSLFDFYTNSPQSIKLFFFSTNFPFQISIFHLSSGIIKLNVFSSKIAKTEKATKLSAQKEVLKSMGVEPPLEWLRIAN
jgi:hypothetical protein